MLFYQWGARPAPRPPRPPEGRRRPPQPLARRPAPPAVAIPWAQSPRPSSQKPFHPLRPGAALLLRLRVSGERQLHQPELGNVTACDFPANKLEKYASTTSIYGQPLEEAEPNAWDFALKYSPDFLQMCAASRDAPPSAFRLPLNSRMWQCQDARLS